MLHGLILIVASSALAQIELDTARLIRTAADPSACGTADFDEDGALDVAVAHQPADFAPPFQALTVLFGDGTGGLGAPARLTIGNQRASALFAGDLDGDGHADVAVAHDGGRLSVLLGDGAGGFSAPGEYGLGFGHLPRHMAAGDFNEDSILDLAVVCQLTDTVPVLLGTGGGAFATGLPFSAGDAPRQVAIADFDSDGHLDFAVTCSESGSNLVSFRFGDGTGLFPGSGSLPIGGLSVGVAAADFDDDGHADLAVSLPVARQIKIVYGDGLGGFPLVDVFDVPPSHRLVVADVDRDGAPDVVAAAPDNDDIVVLRNDPVQGGFDPPRAFHGVGEATDLAIGDFDGDRRLDVVTANTHESVALLLGNGCGGFPVGSRIPVAPAVASVALADFDGDGVLDAAFTDPATGLVAVAPGDGACGFVLPAVTIASGFVEPRGIAAADLDGDSVLDLIAAIAGEGNGSGGGILHLPGVGSGGFAAPVFTAVAGRPWEIAISDMNEDGLLDVASACVGGDTVAVLLGSGGGALGAPTHFPAGDKPRALAVADFDEDGDPDVAVAPRLSRAVAWLSGDGLGGLGAPVFVPVFGEPRALLAGDFDADTHVDLAVTTTSTRGNLAVLSGDGAGGFTISSTTQVSELSVEDVARADLDGDGAAEFVVAHPSPNGVSILEEVGGGALAVTRLFGISPPPIDIAIGDLDLDGRPDLVGALFSQGIAALRNVSFAATSAVIGNVNAAAGPSEDVLFINGLTGSGPERRVIVDPFVLFEVRMEVPSSDLDGSARFALDAWVGESRNWTVERTPFGPIGVPPTCARKTWNNTGDPSFGAPDLPSSPAPSVVHRRQSGIRKRGLFHVQGFIEDAASPSGVYAVTNGILIDSR